MKEHGKKSENKGKDKFGSRIGTNNAKVNACLSSTPKTMTQLVKEAKIEGTVYSNLNKLVKAGYVQQTEKGFKLVKTPA
jgi:hypothetical protein